jgi:hypothetical protein
MINLNGVIYETIESLNTYLDSQSFSEYEKQCLRNDFNGVENSPISAFSKVPVTNRQIREALILFSLQMANTAFHPSSISAVILTLPEPNKSIALNYWEYSNEFYRDNPLISQLAPMLNLTSEQLDQLWDLAKTR